MAQCQVKKGDTIFFWKDNWSTGNCRDLYPELHSFCINENQTFQDFMQCQHLTDNFHLPLSTQSFQQMQALEEETMLIQQSDEADVWTYRWSSAFSSSKAYKVLKEGPLAPDLFQKIWKSAAILRYKIFFWLMIQDS